MLTIYTTAITEQHDRKAENQSILTTAFSFEVWGKARACDVELANLKIEMVDRLTKLREGQGGPKIPEKKGRVKFDCREPQIVQVKNWVGKENLWPDEDGDIELRDAK